MVSIQTYSKVNVLTHAQKVFPPEKMKDLRKISGLLNCSKICDKVIAELLVADMAPKREKLSIQHYLIKMLHHILIAVDVSPQSEAYTVLIGMAD